MIKNNIFNQTTLNGNKFKSEKLIYKSLKKIQKVNKKKDFKKLIKCSLVNSAPIFYIKSIKRKRRKSTEFPFMLPKNIRIGYSLKFILHYSNKLKNYPFYKRLNTELLSSCTKSSKSFNKTKDLYKETFLKKKFSNYRWF